MVILIVLVPLKILLLIWLMSQEWFWKFMVWVIGIAVAIGVLVGLATVVDNFRPTLSNNVLADGTVIVVAMAIAVVIFFYWLLAPIISDTVRWISTWMRNNQAAADKLAQERWLAAKQAAQQRLWRKL